MLTLLFIFITLLIVNCGLLNSTALLKVAIPFTTRSSFIVDRPFVMMGPFTVVIPALTVKLLAVIV